MSTNETDEQLQARTRERITRELPVAPTQTWRFYDGMSRERFHELKAEGALPLEVGDYDDVMRLVAEAKASTV